MSLSERVADDRGYLWDYVRTDDGYAPHPVLARLQLLAEPADQIVAFDAESHLDPEGTTWRVTWLLPQAVAHVAIRREGDPAWGQDTREADRDSSRDTVDAAWVRPIASVRAVELGDCVMESIAHEYGVTTRAATRVLFDDGQVLALPAPPRRRALMDATMSLSPVAEALRDSLFTRA